MESKDKIEQIVKEAFENYEEPVSRGMWDKISQELPQNAPGQSDPGSGASSSAGSSSAGNVITASKGLSAGIWGGAAIVAVTATTLYFVNSGDENEAVTEAQSARSEILIPANETSANSQDNTVNFEDAAASELVETPSAEVNGQQPSANDQNNNSGQPTSELDDEFTSNPGAGVPVAESEIQKQQPASGTAKSIGTSEFSNDSPSEKPQVIQTEDPAVANTETITGNDAPEQVNEPAAVRYELIASPAEGVAPMEVTLTLKAFSGEVTWDFGDGASGFGGPVISHQYEIPGTYTAWAKFTDETGVQHAEPVIVTVEADDFLKNFIPNVFTPNGDGTNDTFIIKSEQLTECEVTIYDRRGRQVARFLDPEIGWDGTLDGGSLAPEGTYFYVIIAKGKEGQAHNYKGTLKLIR